MVRRTGLACGTISSRKSIFVGITAARRQGARYVNARNQSDRGTSWRRNTGYPAAHLRLVELEPGQGGAAVSGAGPALAVAYPRRAIVKSPGLEAWQVEPADSLAADPDQINRPLAL